MNDCEICDRCGDGASAYLAGTFDVAVFGNFFKTFDSFNKDIERDGIRFKYCLACTFETPQAGADANRFIALVKISLGIDQHHEFVAIN